MSLPDASRWRFVYSGGLFGWKRAEAIPPDALDVTDLSREDFIAFATAVNIDRQNTIDRTVNKAYDPVHELDDQSP
jgi:hypothetical protein